MGQKPKSELTIDDLTMKQTLFIDKLIEHWGQKNKMDIVKEVYGEPGKEMSDKSASAIGARLTNRRINPHVVSYLDKRKSEAVAFYEKDKLRRYKRLEYYANSAAGKKLQELSKKIDGHNAKTIDIASIEDEGIE